MPEYMYKAVESDGKVRKGNIIAVTMEQAERKLAAEGLEIIGIYPEEMKRKSILGRKAQLSDKECALFCKHMLTMLKAGVNVINALEMVSEQSSNRMLRIAIAGIIDDISSGETLPMAIKHQDVFSPLFASVLEAGDVSGNMELSFEKMSAWYEKQAKLSESEERLRYYPRIVLYTALIIIVAMTVFVVPRFMSIFDNMDIEMSGLALLSRNISRVCAKYWWIVVPVLALIIGMINMWVNSTSGRSFGINMRHKIPMLRDLQIKIDCAIFARTFAALLGVGVSKVEALETAASMLDDEVVKRIILYARGQVQNGSSLSKYIKSFGVFPAMMVQMIAIGEETGNLEEMLNSVADYYDDEAIAASEHIMAILEPIIILLLALVVGVILMSILQPMLSLYESVKNM